MGEKGNNEESVKRRTCISCNPPCGDMERCDMCAERLPHDYVHFNGGWDACESCYARYKADYADVDEPHSEEPDYRQSFGPIYMDPTESDEAAMLAAEKEAPPSGYPPFNLSDDSYSAALVRRRRRLGIVPRPDPTSSTARSRRSARRSPTMSGTPCGSEARSYAKPQVRARTSALVNGCRSASGCSAARRWRPCTIRSSVPR